MASRKAEALIAATKVPGKADECAALRQGIAEAERRASQAERRLDALRIMRKPQRRTKAAKHILRVVVPDSHGEHIDTVARDVFVRDLAELDPDEILMLGDHLDCGGTFSAHQRTYTNEMTESYSNDVAACNVFLDMIQEAAPRARIHYLEGNHEQHCERWSARNFERRADAQMMVDRMGPAAVLELKRRGITYYRASEFHCGLTVRGMIKLGKLYATHGFEHGKHATVGHMEKVNAPVVHGHTHQAITVYSRNVTSESIGGFGVGCLAKLQPLYRHTAPTKWTHGYGLQLASESSGRFAHVHVPIIGDSSLLPELTGALRGKVAG